MKHHNHSRYEKRVPLLDAGFEAGDVFLAELSARAHSAHSFRAITDWING